jgi:hypothetical protein
MRRREFMTLLGGAVIIRPREVTAQPATARRVGYVWIGQRGTDVTGAGLRKGLAELGYES